MTYPKSFKSKPIKDFSALAMTIAKLVHEEYCDEYDECEFCRGVIWDDAADQVRREISVEASNVAKLYEISHRLVEQGDDLAIGRDEINSGVTKKTKWDKQLFLPHNIPTGLR